MPELGDIEGFRRLADSLAGCRIAAVDALDPRTIRSSRAASERLTGCVIGHAARIGKWLTIPTDGPVVVVHFGMTGSLRMEPLASDRDPFDRVAISMDRLRLSLRDPRRLARLWIAGADEVDAIRGPLGPDALGITAAELRGCLSRGRGALKSALMDQSKIAGIGNFLSDEVAWRAHLHPGTAVGALDDDQWHRLHREASAVLHAVARAGHTPRGPRWLTGARWRDPPTCPRCGAELCSTRIGGRTSVWCPVCQPPLDR